MTGIATLAERVLLGGTLAEKLAPWPEILPDDPPHPRTIVDVPGRPQVWALPPRRREGGAGSLDLQAAGGAARVLHELANHEIQAAELLALALLRWPEAPPRFRRGLAAILRDEVRHANLYLTRMAELGGEPGMAPVSRFFWDTLAPVDEPTRFIAGLSLCFELANLDFALAWERRFLDDGDEATAALLRGVHDDEVRHVSHGRRWFYRWNPEDPLSAWPAALPPPLTPARARGRVFQVESRQRAGFTTEEVARLRVAPGSRGRPPRVFRFDATLEDQLAGEAPSAMARRVTEDLACLPVFLANDEDVVLAPTPPPTLRAAWAEAGFATPTFAMAAPPIPGATPEPWGPHPGGLGWDPAWRALSSKVEATRRAAGIAARYPDRVVHDLGQIWSTIADPPPGPWIAKAPYSTSGTRRIRGDGPLTPAQRSWLSRTLARDGEVVVQPLYARLLDISVHVTVGDAVRLDGITRFFTSPAGVYQGAWLGRWTAGLPGDLARTLHGGSGKGQSLIAPLEAAGRAAGEWAHTLGYRGPLSIDAMLVATPDGPRLHPWLETNARRTLGRIAMALARQVHPGRAAYWRVAPADDQRRTELIQRATRSPPQIRAGLIDGGVLCTNDPVTARSVLTWIEVEP